MRLLIQRNFINFITLQQRSISTSSTLNGKRNFRKFLVYNKRGTRAFKEAQSINPHPSIPIYKRGLRDTGEVINGKFVNIPERIPELVVPDLVGFNLKPYVSYRAPDVIQSEFTSEDLFHAVYAKKVIEDFQQGNLDENGNPKVKTPEENLTAEQAWINARKTGSDIF